MVTFKEKSFVIEFESPSPVEEWKILQNQLAIVITSTELNVTECYLAIALLKEMMPCEALVERTIKMKDYENIR